MKRHLNLGRFLCGNFYPVISHYSSSRRFRCSDFVYNASNKIVPKKVISNSITVQSKIRNKKTGKVEKEALDSKIEIRLILATDQYKRMRLHTKIKKLRLFFINI